MQRTLIVTAMAAMAVLASPVSAEVSVEQSWDAEHAELLGQIRRLKKPDKNLRDRLKAEALDQQALVLPSDKDPLDVVLRRTAALVRYFKGRKMLPSSVLSGFAAKLGKLSAAAKSTPQPDARKKLFTQVCASGLPVESQISADQHPGGAQWRATGPGAA